MIDPTLIGVFGRSHRGRQTFTVGNMTFWWFQIYDLPAEQLTAAEFLRWVDGNNIDINDRWSLDPVAEAQHKKKQELKKQQAAKPVDPYWQLWGRIKAVD